MTVLCTELDDTEIMMILLGGSLIIYLDETVFEGVEEGLLCSFIEKVVK